MKYTVGSCFSGVGGLDLAAHWAGFETAWFVEKEPFCQKVLAKHWPNVPIYSDVFECHDLPHVDVICGGFPCQPFSVAGEQNGEEDERFLLPEMLRIIEETKPNAVLFENVPGFTSLNDGSAFKFLLRCIAEMGFDGCEWGRMAAANVGAPHERERWFCIAYVVNSSKLVPSDLRKSVTRKLQQAVNNAANQWDDNQPIYEKELAYTSSFRQSGENSDNRRTGTYNQNSHNTPNRDSGNSTPSRVGGSSELSQSAELGNATSAGLEGCSRGESRFAQHTGSITSPRAGKGLAQKTELPQPGLGRIADGIPRRLDFVGFPSRPGDTQYNYEPPRTAPSTKDTNSRIKALGNAVVPQVAYPIFEALMEWLDEINDV